MRPTEIDTIARRPARRWRLLVFGFAVTALGFFGVAAAAPGALPLGLSFAVFEPGPTGQSGPAAVTGSTGAGGMVLSASLAQPGYVSLSVAGATGSSVAISELTAANASGAPVGVVTPAGGAATLAHASEWSCASLQRTFEATETDASGATESSVVSVTTPSCATRVTARPPTARLHSDHPADIVLNDTWGTGGLAVRGCIDAPGSQRCLTVRFLAGQRRAVLRLRLGTPSRQLVEISDPYEQIGLQLHVSSARPVLLATGDSQMQVLDTDLAADLAGPAGASVIADARVGTAISTPFVFDWPAHALAQVSDEHPDIVAMFLSGNEGFAVGGVDCCGLDWSSQYALKVEGMMRTYLQDGRGAVYWFLTPTPSSANFALLVNAVNRGIVIAAKAVGRGVHLFDLRPMFSPGGRYIDTLSYAGQTITVHEPDGYHLSQSADVIVAQLFVARLRRDGLIS